MTNDALLLRACALACRVAARDAAGLNVKRAGASLRRAVRIAQRLRTGRAAHNRIARIARVTVEQTEKAVQVASATKVDPVHCAHVARSAIRAAEAALRESTA